MEARLNNEDESQIDYDEFYNSEDENNFNFDRIYSPTNINDSPTNSTSSENEYKIELVDNYDGVHSLSSLYNTSIYMDTNDNENDLIEINSTQYNNMDLHARQLEFKDRMLYHFNITKIKAMENSFEEIQHNFPGQSFESLFNMSIQESINEWERIHGFDKDDFINFVFQNMIRLLLIH